MTQNLFNYYAGLVSIIKDDGQRMLVRDFLRYTPYYFSEPVDFKSTVPSVPEQFNLPSPETVIQCDIRREGEGVCLLILLNEAKQEIVMYRAVENSLAGHLIGNFKKAFDGFPYLELWYIEESEESRRGGFRKETRLSADLEQIYSVIINRLLLYINRLGPRSPQISLPRPQRRAVGRSLGYPLKATTEITISQHPPVTIKTRTGQGGHKCLHEVKGHVRIYHRGTPQELCVWIKSHDRGDAKYGVKKTKYRVETDRGERYAHK